MNSRKKLLMRQSHLIKCKYQSDFKAGLIRDLPLVTIDRRDSKDFDDAVYAEQNGENWRLVVAIADVSSYVKHQAN